VTDFQVPDFVELIGGLEPRPIHIVDYSDEWPRRYAHERHRIVTALGPRALLVEHIGSTSVPGLGAKPIVDILVVVADADDEDAFRGAFEAAGYALRVREPRHRMFRTPERDVHVHVYGAGDEEISGYLRFRNWLRRNPDDRRAYEALKRDLAKRDWNDMNAYANAKTDLVEEIKARAMNTDLLYLGDSYLVEFDAVVIAIDGDRVALDRTAFYPTGGGQPHDNGTLGDATVIDVRKEGDVVWHTLEGAIPALGETVHGTVDWARRHQLMRTHSAMHVLCGVIWNEWGKAVTGGNMEPLEGRMDFEFDPLPEGFAARVAELVNAEITADRPIEISFLPRDTAVEDEDLIRTKVNLIPESVKEIRVVDIVGLDKQADGGTHVQSTGEIGGFEVVKTESKGKGNKRIRMRVLDAASSHSQ
jgi:misacylated tRNA(Ala) deacylase